MHASICYYTVVSSAQRLTAVSSSALLATKGADSNGMHLQVKNLTPFFFLNTERVQTLAQLVCLLVRKKYG